MSWTVNPEWKPEDIFKLSKMELERLKLHVAKKLECKYRNVGGAPLAWAYAQDVGGRAAFTESGAEAAIETYMKLIENKPTTSQGESDEAIKKRESEWTHELSRVSTWSTVVNGCQRAWESPNGPME